MENEYWKQFATTGRIDDYLSYKGMSICENIMKKYEDQKRESVNHSDRDGDLGITNRRIR